MSISILEHSSAKYSPRTWLNAKSSDLTVAFAVDFSTGGEKLTHKAASGKYVGVDIRTSSVLDTARQIYREAKRLDAKVFNVAGNGIYTLHKHGWDQKRINTYVFQVFEVLHQHIEIRAIRSGGQTGVDIAGGYAAFHLGIDAIITLPCGFIQRGIDGIDRAMSQQQIFDQISKF